MFFRRFSTLSATFLMLPTRFLDVLAVFQELKDFFEGHARLGVHLEPSGDTIQEVQELVLHSDDSAVDLKSRS